MTVLLRHQSPRALASCPARGGALCLAAANCLGCSGTWSAVAHARCAFFRFVLSVFRVGSRDSWNAPSSTIHLPLKTREYHDHVPFAYCTRAHTHTLITVNVSKCPATSMFSVHAQAGRISSLPCPATNARCALVLAGRGVQLPLRAVPFLGLSCLFLLWIAHTA